MYISRGHSSEFPNQDVFQFLKIVSAYSKACVKQQLSKRPKIGFQDGQKYCRMLPLEHSAILSTFIKLPFVIKIFVLFIFEWLFYTGFTVCCNSRNDFRSELCYYK